MLIEALFGLVLTLSAVANETPSANPDDRIREPVLLEGRNFRLLFDRHDPTFRLEDRGAGISWHSALDRRGFASLLLPSSDGNVVEWPIDKMTQLRVQSNAIRFQAASSRGEIPNVEIALSITVPVESLEISFSTSDSFLDRGGAVKILDRLWMSDSDSGGALIPVGLGEWLDFETKTPIERDFGCSVSEGTAAPLLRGLGLWQGRSALFVSWEHDAVAGRVVRRSTGSTPSTDAAAAWQLETSFVLHGAARSLNFHVLSSGERHDFLNYCHQWVTYSRRLPTVRQKSRKASGPPPFVGSALFRVPLGSEGFRTFEDVAKFSASLRDRLGIDRACLIVENWLAKAEGSAPWVANVDPERGGEKGLTACANALRENAHVLGVDLPVVSACETFGVREVQNGIESLQPVLGQPLIVVRDDKSPARRDACGPPPCVDDLAQALSERFYLLGTSFAAESLFRNHVYLEGAVDLAGDVLNSPSFYPFTPAVLGRRARLGVAPENALEVGGSDAVLDFLLLAEVPLYGLPGRASRQRHSTTSAVFSRGDGGWFEGRDLGPQERFIKTTYEVLTQVARLRAREELHSYERVGDDGTVQTVRYGFDLRIVINRGEKPYADPDGRFVLPQYGFWIQHPFFFGFHASMAHGVTYDKPALFTVRPLENKLWLRASKVRIWHAFGDPVVRLGGKRFKVEKGELFTKVW